MGGASRPASHNRQALGSARHNNVIATERYDGGGRASAQATRADDARAVSMARRVWLSGGV
jgi:hypothetical protein